MDRKLLAGSWGRLPKKKPVAAPKSVNWHWFFVSVFFLFLDSKIGNCLFVFFGIWFGQNSKVETGFWVSLFLFGFLGLIDFFGFLFRHVILGFESHPKN